MTKSYPCKVNGQFMREIRFNSHIKFKQLHFEECNADGYYFDRMSVLNICHQNKEILLFSRPKNVQNEVE